jgi:TM2 domain-containing membrane protein YozV
MYFLWLNESQSGPFTIGQLKSMWAAGQITVATLYWQEGMGEWMPLQYIIDQVAEPTPLPVVASFTPPPFDQTAALHQNLQQTVSAAAASAQQAANRQILFEAQKKSAGLACLLNFLLPGIGYMYAGRVIIGIFVLILWSFFILLGFVTFGIGAIPAAIIWLVGIIDGFLAVNSANKALALKMIAGGS